MTQLTSRAPDTEPRLQFAPVAELATVSLSLVIVGGILMASYFPTPPPLTAPTALLAGSVALFAVNVVILLGQKRFAWKTFLRVGRWALVAYVVSAAMIEYAFVHNRASGGPLVVVSLMLVMFALNVPLIISFTVARYQQD